MTETEAAGKLNSRNGNVPPEATANTTDDAFDHTYKEKEGPKPPRIIVWKNVVLMTLLHIGALYGVFLIPSASPLTLLWCKYILSTYYFITCRLAADSAVVMAGNCRSIKPGVNSKTQWNKNSTPSHRCSPAALLEISGALVCHEPASPLCHPCLSCQTLRASQSAI